MTGGLRWRVFAAMPEADGTHALIVESNLAQPTLTLPPGDYVVHVAFGLASATKRLTLGPEVRSERAGHRRRARLRIGGTLADAPIDPSKLSLAIYVPEGRNPQGKLVYAKAKAGDVDRPAGGRLPYRLDLSRHGRRTFLARAAPPSTGKSAGAGAVDDASVRTRSSTPTSRCRPASSST